MKKHESLINKKFGKLTVVELVKKEPRIIKSKKSGYKYFYKCKCDCGNECIVASSNLGRNTFSCGCIVHEKLIERNKTHNLSNTKIYKQWKSMKWRCKNKNAHNADSYYNKGINVCNEWIDDFLNFYNWSLKNGYKEGLSLDRINNNKGYSPENCRWVTMKEQSNNTTRNHFITYQNITKTISQWADILHIKYSNLYSELVKNNFKIENIIDKNILKENIK